MITFQTLLEERKSDTIAVLNGRMTPVTTGHEENVRGLHKLATEHKADHIVLATHSHDIKTKGAENKNPLSPAEKEKHLKRAFPNTNIKMTSKEKPSIFHHLSDLHKQGYKHLILASGEDRVEDYERIKQYNGKEGKHGYYNFKSIETKSTGERKPGISGTDMRKHAESSNFEKFKSGLASNLRKNNHHAKEIFNDVRHGMGLNESKTYNKKFGHVQISKFEWGTPEGTREMKRITPGEKKTKTEEKEADYGSKFQDMVKRVKVSAQQGPKKTVWVPAKYGTGGSYKVVPDTKVKESVESNPMQLSPTKIPFLLMTTEQKRSLFEETDQLEFDGIQTRNLDICPSAYKAFKSMIEDIRAGKHLGEPTGHEPDKLPYPGATPEQGLRPQEIKTGTTSTDALNQVVAGMAVKPKLLRQMQFRIYTGL